MSFTGLHLYLDDVAVGEEWQSQGRTLTQADIVNFAGLSGDFNPIHIDHEFARTTHFRQPIAHGLLVFSMASGLGVNCPPLRTLAFLGIRDWQFKAPVFIGDTIHVRTQLVEKELRGRGRRGVATWQRYILNQAGKVVQQGISLTLVECRAANGAALSVPAPGDGNTP
ncbi:MAG TPA: MaoC/PaaZ C-terminal domain-containing protein [Gemmataceae bacterium]|nr:MaoC/PaaZ C-terminal domain-containing protein [Gemmataceae bacterium]